MKSCLDCGSAINKYAKRCRACDKAWRRKAMTENPLRFRHGYAKRDETNKQRPEYYVWTSMIQRCTNSRSSHFKHYGARGVKVCARWRRFDNFLADMGPRPVGTHASGSAMFTVERKDVNGDYEPSNCIWATTSEQGLNRRNNFLVEYRGEKRPLSHWVRLLGLNYKIVYQRITRDGFDVEYAFSKGVR